MTRENLGSFKLRVVNGPSKFDLMLGLFEGKPVDFTVSVEKDGKEIKSVFIVKVSSISTMPSGDPRTTFFIIKGESIVGWSSSLEITYCPKTRRGWGELMNAPV